MALTFPAKTKSDSSESQNVTTRLTAPQASINRDNPVVSMTSDAGLYPPARCLRWLMKLMKFVTMFGSPKNSSYIVISLNMSACVSSSIGLEVTFQSNQCAALTRISITRSARTSTLGVSNANGNPASNAART